MWILTHCATREALSFFLKSIHLFIWLPQVLIAVFGIFVASCRIFVEARGLSPVVVCGLSCPVACGISVPQPRIEPVPPALQGRFLITGPPGKSPLPHSRLDIKLPSSASPPLWVVQFFNCYVVRLGLSRCYSNQQKGGNIC